MNNFDMDRMRELMSSRLQNYIVPGMVSSLIAAAPNGENGRVRIFENSREQLMPIVPHSHRFSFQCLVLQGHVINMLWHPDENGEYYTQSVLHYEGEVGKYTKSEPVVGCWSYTEDFYKTGDWYSMAAQDIHSIEFSKDAIVLFFEGVSFVNSTLILEPNVEGETIPTMAVQPWMFKKDTND